MKIEIVRGFFKQLLGLMFRRDFEGLMIFVFKKPTKTSFHTFFMFFPIDIYFFLNNELKEYYINVRPWRIILPKYKFNIVIECKSGKYNIEEIKKVLASLKL